MKKIDKKSELARLLCKLLRSCDREDTWQYAKVHCRVKVTVVYEREK